jgi:hypothetical protein
MSTHQSWLLPRWNREVELMIEPAWKVEIFLGPMACSCSGMPSPAKLEKIDRALNLRRSIEKDYGGFLEVRTYDLGDEADYEEGLKLLGGYLKDAGETDLADRLAFAINDATPSVAVDGKLLWIRECPDIDELGKATGLDEKSRQ